MISESKALRQLAELLKAGHQLNLDSVKLCDRTAKDLNQLVEVTKSSGGPLAKTIDRMAEVLMAREQSENELNLAVAGPTASSRLVLSLPILVFVGAGIAGIPIFRTLLEPSFIWLSLALGGLLFWSGKFWTGRLLRQAKPTTQDPGLCFDALAISIQAGLPIRMAIELVSRHFGELEALFDDEFEAIAGVALLQFITDRANLARLDKFNADRLKIQKTSVSVLWPLGLTVLPAFVLIAIVPIGAALIQTN